MTQDLATTNTQLDFILLDASSSMIPRWWESLSAIDAYVAGLRTANLNTHLKLATFTSINAQLQYDAARDCPLPDYVPCMESSPSMWAGGTPLYDAINRAIRVCRDANPTKCSILIVTDGQENASHTTLAQAKTLLDWARRQGWQITFLGCDFDNTAQAQMLGSDLGSCVGTSARRLCDATSELARKRTYHSVHGTPMHFTEAERTRFGGYLGSR